ncbi:MAG TPA: glycerate kinase [Usitatibacter sp.]|nr:glycerate kinase [Usitatibacter sp.]
MADARELLLESFRTAVSVADPLRIVPAHLPKPPRGRTVVVGAGKAAGAMALAVEQHWPEASPLEGVVITRYGHSLPTRRVRVIEAGHPVPDAQGEAAAREILAAASSLTEDDLLLALVSGGGSALLSLPAEGIAMEDLRSVTRSLLASGAPIQDMNTVRKHLSAIQGGRLAAATRARVLALVISDVTGDDPTHIASGPCTPDPTTFADAAAILRRNGVALPASIAARLEAGIAGRVPETPKPGDAAFARVENRVIATAQASLAAAGETFRAHGVSPMILGDSVTGESREVAKVFAAFARQIRQHGQPLRPPVALVSGGETTVTIRGSGRGGRCTEFLLSLAIELAGLERTHAIACDTDGIDGSEDNAGALLGPDSLARAAAAGLDAGSLLADNDGYGFFSALGDLVVTGPTRTNVNDYRAILVA